MFRESMRLLRKTGKSLVLFEAGIQLITLVVFVPLVGAVTEAAIHLAGLRYLTNSNISKLLTSVWTLPMVALIILIAVLQMLIHFTGAIACLNAAHKGQRLSFSELIYEILSGVRRMFAPGAGTLVLHLLVLIPAVSVPAAGGFISALGIPDILSRNINNPDLLMLAYAGAVLVCMLLSLRWMIALPVYVCRRCSFRAARYQSRSLISGRSFKVLIGLLAWSLAYLAAFVSALIIVTGVGIGVISLCGNSVSYGSEPLRVIRYCLLFVAFMFSAGAVPYLSAGMYARYENLLSTRKTLHHSTAAKSVRKHKRSRIIAILSAIALIWVDGAYIVRLASGEAAVRFVLNVHPMSIAHRGASAAAPENTAYAFIAALDMGADGIELDVQQTKDGVPVVIHDLNLKRVAGINKKISSLTYEELSDIDVGSWFDPIYGDARIMALEDAIALIDGKAFLNIELKRGAQNDGIEEYVAALIEEYNIEDKCCVTSFSYESLERIKECCPDIRTGLIMSIATGNFYDLEAADAFSIKSTFVTAQVVSNAHQCGKEVYAWTVNSTGEMRRMLNLNVDHIITDRPELLSAQIERDITEDTLLDTALRLIS